VIAAFVLLDARATHGAERNVSSVLLGPALELAIHGLFARDELAVPHIPALKADFSGALRTLYSLSLLIFRPYRTTTAGLGAEANQRVALEDLRCFESLIFCEQVLRQVLVERQETDRLLASELEAV